MSVPRPQFSSLEEMRRFRERHARHRAEDEEEEAAACEEEARVAYAKAYATAYATAYAEAYLAVANGSHEPRCEWNRRAAPRRVVRSECGGGASLPRCVNRTCQSSSVDWVAQ